MLVDIMEQLEQLIQLSEMVITSPVALSRSLGSTVGLGLWGVGLGGRGGSWQVECVCPCSHRASW